MIEYRSALASQRVVYKAHTQRCSNTLLMDVHIYIPYMRRRCWYSFVFVCFF